MSDYGGCHFVNLSRDQNRKILIYRICLGFALENSQKGITLYKRNAHLLFYYFHYNGCYFEFNNSEVMTSFPHNLVLDSQPRFGLT